MENNWLQMRAGKFTASEIHRLMVSGTRPANEAELAAYKLQKSTRKTVDILFGEGANTYIREVIAEILMGAPIETRETEAMQWGKTWESTAINKFREKYGIELEYFGGDNPVFYAHQKFIFAGGSPDALNSDSDIEAKCPFNPANHVDFLKAQSCANQSEWLKKEWFDYWCQIQFNMLVCDKKKGFLISFDPRMIEDSHKLAVLEIEPCEAFRSDVNNRLSEAGKIIHNELKLINNEQLKAA